MSKNGVWGRVAMMPSQSGDVAGQGWTQFFQIAEAGFTRGNVGMAMGLVDDPWAISGNAAWGHVPWTTPMSARNGWGYRSDLGAVVAWQNALLLASLTVSAGEGSNAPDTNTMPAVAGFVRVTPNDELPVAVELYGSYGTVGVDDSANHRAGLRVHGDTPTLGYGLEGVYAVGIGGDEDRTPWGASAWVNAGTELPVAAALRADVWNDDGNNVRVLAYAGPRIGPGVLALGVENTRTPNDDVTMATLQLGSVIAGRAPL